MTHPLPRAPDYALLFAIAAIWGASFMLIKLAVGTVPPVTVTAIRVLLGALILVGIVAATGRRLPARRAFWGAAFLSGLFGFALPFTLISWGEERIDSGLAAILMAGMPLATIFLARFVSGNEPLTVNKLVGVAFGIGGLLILIGPAALGSAGGNTLRELAVVLAALCYSVNAIVAKRIAGEDPYAASAAILIAGSALLVPASLMLDRPWTLAPSAPALFALATLGILSTATASLIMLTLLRRQGAGFFAQNNFLVPLFGVFWGSVLLAEHPPASSLTALAFILAGVAISRGAPGFPRRVFMELPK